MLMAKKKIRKKEKVIKEVGSKKNQKMLTWKAATY
jgi:hypothetical protein